MVADTRRKSYKMEPKVVTLENMDKILKHIESGLPIVFPTETVYGIGVSIKRKENLKRLFNIKRRKEDKPIALMASSVEVAKKYLFFSEMEMQIANHFYPGPITMLLKRKKNLPNWYFGNYEKIGLRIPSNEIALKILSFYGDVLSVTSANISNFSPAKRIEEAIDYFKGNDELLFVDGGEVEVGIPSTLFEVFQNEVKIIREGAVFKEELERVLK